MNTYVINLPERTDKRAAARKQLERCGIVHEIVPAIRDVNDGLRRTQITILREAPPGPLCIFEDDFVLCPNFLTRYRELKPPTGWKVIYLGGSTLADYRDGTAFPCATQATEHLWETRETVGMEACLFAPHAREEVIATLEAWPEHPPDVAMIALQKRGGVYCCIPRLCWQAPGVSDRSGQRQETWSHFYAFSPAACVGGGLGI
jgi:hypothetical protein